jgi:hypothetical protein
MTKMHSEICEAVWRERYGRETEVGYIYYDSQSDPSNPGWVLRGLENAPKSMEGDNPLEGDITDDEFDVAEAAVPEGYGVVWVQHPDGVRGHIYRCPPC